MWEWYEELDKVRQQRDAADGSLLPRSYQEIMAWAWLSGRRPEWFEVELLVMIEQEMSRQTPPPQPEEPT